VNFFLGHPFRNVRVHAGPFPFLRSVLVDRLFHNLRSFLLIWKRHIEARTKHFMFIGNRNFVADEYNLSFDKDENPTGEP